MEIEALDVTDNQIRQIRDAAYEAEINAIVESETTTNSELESLNNAVAKTKTDRYKERKGNLIRTYGNCSQELVKADDDGYFKLLQLLYYLIAAATFVSTYDSKPCEKFTSKSQSLDHEIGRSILGVKVAVLKNLGIEQLLDGKPFSNDHPVAKIIANAIRVISWPPFGENYRHEETYLHERAIAFLGSGRLCRFVICDDYKVGKIAV